jgi:hypothetical protein
LKAFTAAIENSPFEFSAPATVMMQGSTPAIASMQILGTNAVTSPEPDLIADSEPMPIAPVMPRQPPIIKTWP